jgi:hypothetical protein
MGTLYENVCTFVITRSVILKMRNVLSKVVQKITTYIVSAVPLPEKCAVFEKMCLAGQATDDNIMRRKRAVSCMPEATDTHSEYILPLLFHGNNGSAKAPQCYVIRTSPALLSTAEVAGGTL